MSNANLSVSINDPRTVRAWCIYDWANSVYSLVISSSIFPIYYKAIAVENGSDQITFLGYSIKNSILYTYSLSFSFLIVALILPLLSGMADYAGRKKFFMKIFVFIGGFSCMGLFFFKSIDDLYWGIFCSIMASIGYSGSLVFYDAFLPEIVSEDPKGVVKSLAGIGALVVIFILCYAVSGDEVTAKYTSLGVGSGSSKLIGAGLIMFYAVMAISMVGVIYSEISKALK